MKTNKFSITKSIVVSMLCLMSWNTFANHHYSFNKTDITQIGRYASVKNQPTLAQINPLLAIAQFKFQSNIRTIGGAIRHVLLNTSYQLAPYKHLSKIVRKTLSKTLPITDRTLGPLSIKEAIHVLIGKEVFDLAIDPVNRLIGFKVKPKIQHLLGDYHAI